MSLNEFIMQSDQNRTLSSSGEELDVMEYVAKLWRKRLMLLKWCCVGAVIGLIIGFSLPKTYKSSVTLAPETDNGTGGSVNSIASMMGVSLDNGTDAIGVEMLPDIAHSVPFIVGLFDVKVQFQRAGHVVNTTLIDYMLNYQRKPWWSPIVGFPKKVLSWCMSLADGEQGKNKILVQDVKSRDFANLTLKERNVVRCFSENLVVSVDKKVGKTRIDLEMQDPLVVYTVVQAVVEHLKEYISDYRTSKVRQDVVNLTAIYEDRKADYYVAQQAYARYIDANKNVVLQSAQAERERLQQEMNLAYQVYSQVATRLEAARIKEQETKPVFVVLEPAVIPIFKAAPSKAKLLVLFALLAGCAVASWVLFGDDVLAAIKDMGKED